MNKPTFSLKTFSATTVLSALAFIGTTTLSLPSVVTTVAALSIMYSPTAEAKVICRDKPIDTRKSRSRYFKYQPMKKIGLFKCKKAGGIKKIKMLIPRLPSGVKLIKGGRSRMRGANGCSGGGVKLRTLFHTACNAHDICYRSLGTSKFKCEDLFLKNMLKISKHGPVGSRVKALSLTTFVGVGPAAHREYKNGQKFARKNYK